jgi:hypothetical protein
MEKRAEGESLWHKLWLLLTLPDSTLSQSESVEDGEANRHVVFKDAPGHRLVQGRWRASIFSVVVLVVLDAEHDVDAGVDSEVGDLFDNGGGAPDVNDSLVDAHLVVVVGVGTVTARGTARRDGEHLGGDALGAGDLEALLLAAGNDLRAGVFKGLDVTAAEGHSNLVDFLADLNFLLHVFLCHCSERFLKINNNFLFNNT